MLFRIGDKHIVYKGRPPVDIARSIEGNGIQHPEQQLGEHSAFLLRKLRPTFGKHAGNEFDQKLLHLPADAKQRTLDIFLVRLEIYNLVDVYKRQFLLPARAVFFPH